MNFSRLCFCLLFVAAGCSDILREPELNLNEASSVGADIDYEITAIEVTPDVISKANQNKFERLVTVGGRGVQPARQIPETELFSISGDRLPSNVKQKYKLGVGDNVKVTRTGYDEFSNGVRAPLAQSHLYVISESGTIELLEGQRVFVQGLEVSEAEIAIQSALTQVEVVDEGKGESSGFPTVRPTQYGIGVGDVIQVSRLISKSDRDGNVTQDVRTSRSAVGQDGIVSLLELGDIDVLGLSISEFRESVVREAVRNAAGTDVIVEVAEFASQSVLITGDIGTSVVRLSDKPRSYDKIVAELNPNFQGGRDYLIKLDRGGNLYQMHASELLLKHQRDKYFAHDGDRLSISQILPSSQVKLELVGQASQNVSFLRVGSERIRVPQSGGSTIVPIGLNGLHLRQLLVLQNVEVGQNDDLLVTIWRNGREYVMSARSILLGEANKKYWLSSGDRVVVESIAYASDSALLVGAITGPRRLPLDQYRRTTLSAALFDGGAFESQSADFRHIYVLRGKDLTYSAYHFDISQVLNLTLAEKFELRPADIIFVRTKPLTKYNRALALVLTFGGSLKSFESLVE